MGELVPMEAVRSEIMAGVQALDPVEIDRTNAHGLVLADDVMTAVSVPPFANTAMDGYAVRAADTTEATVERPVTLRVVGDLPAGHAPEVSVGPGEAIRIMTGAPMPPGADAVVMVERTRPSGPGEVQIQGRARVGEHVREVGGDLQAGQRVFEAGTLLGAPHIGVLASIGADRLRVVPRPRVGVFSTGDELRDSGALGPGAIRDSNRPMLMALLREADLEVVDLGIVVDDEGLITKTLEQALATCDAVLTSGGVSVGDYDYMKAALERLGSLQWRQIAIKPAKPLAFGFVAGTPVFGLPGNPASSLVGFELFARPALLARAGRSRCFRPEVLARAGSDFARRPDGKLHLDRVVVRRQGDDLVATLSGAQASNVLSSTALANGLAMVPDGDGVREGAPLRVMLIDGVPDH